MFAWYGAAGQLYSYDYASSTRSNIISCAMPRSTNLLKAEEPRHPYELQLYSIGAFV